ncbi:MAG: hypothetical protein ACNA7X_05350 [Dehalococcoidia bacterium]
MRSFQGARQYDRVSLTEGSDLFKAAVYIHGANHGQFNTRWGRIDQSFSRLFLDRSNIMPPDVQELTAKAFISSFLEDTLRGFREYRRLFTDPSVRRYWLPETFCHIQYLDGATMIVADFEEDMDLTTLTIDGGRAVGENLVSWREEPLELGPGTLRNSTSVRLGWDAEREGEAAYTLVLPEGFSEQVDATSLTFALANVSPGRAPVDFTIVVRDSAGEEASLPLSHIATLLPPPQYRMFKRPLGVEFLSEPVFSTYTFLLSDFSAANAALDPGAIAGIRFLFDSTSGAVYLDDVGLNR